MDLRWLLRNARTAWRSKASVPDFFRRMLWIYRIDLDAGEWQIGFRYPAVGELHLSLRTKSGADCFIFGEVFDHQYYRLPLASPPATILDLGAHIGLTAIYFARVFPKARIACVEPHPDNVRLLRKNLQANAVEAAVFAAQNDA